MQRGKRLTTKQKIEVANRIFEQYATGLYTLESCCEAEGITDRTLRNWAEKISAISASLKKAKIEAEENSRADLREKARFGLLKKVTGFEVTEKKTFYDADDNVTKIIETTKYIPPSDTAIIFVLTNLDPDNFKHLRAVEVTAEAEPGPEIDFSELTDDELKIFVDLMRKAEAKGEQAKVN